MKNFRDLKVWQKAHDLTLKIYRETKSFPAQEQHGITSQMRRAAISVTTNIAEGCCRSSDTEFARFLVIAFASASELEYLLLLSKDLELIDSKSHTSTTTEVEEVKRMLYSFIQKLKNERT
jgi:four helix bundle protein